MSKRPSTNDTFKAYLSDTKRSTMNVDKFDDTVANRGGSKASPAYIALGLTGEAGEVADMIKKSMRHGELHQGHKSEILLEIGDVLWYASAMAQHLGWTLADVMALNDTKLRLREEAGVHPLQTGNDKHLTRPIIKVGDTVIINGDEYVVPDDEFISVNELNK